MTITPSDTSFVPRKRPQQVRAQETINRLMAAARKVFRESRAHAMTTRAIASVSGFRVGSIYQYFGKKEDIFVYLLQYSLKRISRSLR